MKPKEAQALEGLPLLHGMSLCPSFVWHPTNLFNQNHSFFLHRWISGKCQGKEVPLLGNGLVAGHLLVWFCAMIKEGWGCRVCNLCVKWTKQKAWHRAASACVPENSQKNSSPDTGASPATRVNLTALPWIGSTRKGQAITMPQWKRFLLLCNQKVPITTILNDDTASTEQADPVVSPYSFAGQRTTIILPWSYGIWDRCEHCGAENDKQNQKQSWVSCTPINT